MDSTTLQQKILALLSAHPHGLEDPLLAAHLPADLSDTDRLIVLNGLIESDRV